MSRTFHVSIDGSDAQPGTSSSPLRTISRAAELAQPGDTVLVHQGTYREWVRPPRGGVSDRRRITYAAAPGERPVITGSEVVTGWIREDRTDLVGAAGGDRSARDVSGAQVWRATIPNTLFGDFNPFATELFGDWLVRPDPRDPGTPKRHAGAVYLDGRSLSEAPSREAVAHPARGDVLVDDWTQTAVPVPDPEWAVRTWFAEVDAGGVGGVTTVWAHFGAGVDPNEHLIEVNVRPAVFLPRRHHIDWITVRGFELAQAATQWAPPTAEQPGLIGPNWAKGWLIEDNVIHDSRCSGVSLGKEASTGQNFASVRRDKPGYQYQLESVFAARQIGWDQEHIGSHVVRRNEIFDCGQTGIVGHLGCVFSTIEDNDIHDIATRREFFGHEIAGIKLHAAIDVTIRHNHIHRCTLGTWLDWETQGTRISRNVYHDNCRDLFVEVSHGPYLVEHNVFASPAALEVVSGGGAFVHNLVAGTVRVEPVMDRATPYHRPHSTQVAGYSVIPGGDDRWVGNLFVGGDPERAYGPGFRGGDRTVIGAGTACYDGYPASFEEYLEPVLSADGTHDHDTFYGRRLPAYVRHNVYAGGARPFEGEAGAAVLDGAASVAVGPDPEAVAGAGDSARRGVILGITLPQAFAAPRMPRVGGADLERTYFADAEFEERDGRPAVMDTDLVGDVAPAGALVPAGPLHALREGRNELRIW
ncbi:MAG: right-handed parallel beta-helix repeat-containing protein [Actinomyces sp.]|jgi:hypothetical protein|nr:right-handed parallel beta-helix repeat-containing protein [Actinomyces sp.]MCI1641734.1 right-handed parallel beta-helix repeat-containing protein [Actinomyces sp.]MCI1661550.1 right-handed parallel beta-helix repeat-containing protein [Actinomyces sp.]MCI1690629.1 right-handed parallel beta-helix repeat-containing protein [Actinomyces sp.]